MELLLNLLWLLLALPAYCMWRDARDSSKSDGPSPLQCLLALGCVLVLLFPVVSATDDLHAMRAEMEESSKRGMRSANDKSSAAQSRWQNPFVAVAAFSPLAPLSETWRELRVPQPVLASVPFSVQPGRAPPGIALP
jgi:hypothetical protein